MNKIRRLAYKRLILKGDGKMKLGEIKLEALMLCFANPALGIDTEDEEVFLSTLNNLKYDANYEDYLNAMPGAINRCFSAIEHKGILPSRTVRLTGGALPVNEGFARLELGEIADDINRLESVTLVSSGVIIPHMPFTRLGGDTILLHPIGEKDEYVLIYEPRIPRVRMSTPETYNVDLPDNITELIPYFIKGDILRVDDANEAAAARNIFEKMCDEIYDASGEDCQGSVKTVYSQES